MKRLSLLIFLLLIFATPNVSSAAEMLHDANIFIGAEQTYSENLYIGAGNTIIEGNVNADLVVFGGEVTVSGQISGDVFLGGGNVVFKGDVLGDLRVIGGTIKIEGTVGGDVLIIGGQVDIENTAEIRQDIFVVGGKVNIQDDFATELTIISANVRINSAISGETEVTTQNLWFGPNSNISGDFSYYAPQKFSAETGAVITGNVRFNEINLIRDTGFVKKALVSFMSFWFLLRFITTLIVAFILVYIFKIFSQETTNLALNSFGKSLLAGILILIFVPIVIMILFISLVALPIGFLLLISLIFVVIISPAISGIFLGTWAKKYIYNDNTGTVDFKAATLGVIALTLLQFVPIIGGLIILILTITAIGAIAREIRIAVIR